MRGSCLDKYINVTSGSSKQKFLALPLNRGERDKREKR